MGLNWPIDITAEQRKTVLALLARHLPNTMAWVYGSRVKWTARPESDLDLVVFARPEQSGRVSDLREAFEESNLPFRVDLFVWDDVPEQFRKQIEAEHVVLVEREEQKTARDWHETTLGGLLSFANGKSSPRRSDGLPHAVYGSNGIIGFSDQTNADPNTIVVGRVGTYCGSLHYCNRICWVTDNAIRSTAINRNDAKFLFYLLQTLRLNEWRAGSGQPLLNQTILSSIPVAVPEPPEQRAIAHILGTLDDKIELNRRMNETLEEMARALFKSWFVDFDPVHAKATLNHHVATLPPGGSDWSVERARAYLDRMDPNIAALFPDSFADSELGPIPAGWEVKKIGDVVRRISVGKKYSQKTAAESGIVPILDQGKSGIIGYHNDKPGVTASTSEPIIVFANHTCYMRLIMHDFSAIQNVLPFEGKNHDIYWLFCATTRKQEFIEYKGHWPDFLIKEIVVPERTLQSEFGRVVAAFFRQAHINDSQSRTLTALRDALLPKLVSGEIRVADAKKQVEAIA